MKLTTPHVYGWVTVTNVQSLHAHGVKIEKPIWKWHIARVMERERECPVRCRMPDVGCRNCGWIMQIR